MQKHLYLQRLTLADSQNTSLPTWAFLYPSWWSMWFTQMTPQLNRKAVTQTLTHRSPLPLLTHGASQVSTFQTSCIKPVNSQNSPSENYYHEDLAHAGFSIIHFHKLSLMGILLQRQDSRKTIAMNNCVLLQISIFKYRARGQPSLWGFQNVPN